VSSAKKKLSTLIPRAIEHSPRVFDEQMRLVKRHYNPITMSQLVDCLRDGSALPRRSVVISFDDGYRNNHTMAAPILDRYSMKAIFYVISGAIESQVPPWFCRSHHAFMTTIVSTWRDVETGESISLESVEGRNHARRRFNRRVVRYTDEERKAASDELENSLKVSQPDESATLMMSWDMLRDLGEAGHEIGSHTQSHPNLTQIEAQQVIDEVQVSKKIIEKHMMSPIIHFSYPNPMIQPHWNSDISAVIERACYTTAVTSESGTVNKLSNLFCLPRSAVPSTVEELRWRLDKLFAGFK
jgi:peptidoglycan/xylan/chitin deacetylase (PgdA/CDA1 family)